MLKKIKKNDNFLSLAGNLIFSFLGFLNIFLIARSFSSDDYGIWILYLTSMSFAEMIRMGILQTPMVKFLSSSKKENKNEIIASSWILGLFITLLFSIVIYTIYFFFYEEVKSSNFDLFFKFYPILSFLTLPSNTALFILQSNGKFDKIIFLRFFSKGFFSILLIINYFYLDLNVENIVMAHLFFAFLTSLISILKSWSGINLILKYKIKKIKELMNFGKFSLGTLMGSNLLKSSDTFLIGIMMTKGDVAFYSIPLKLIEVLEIPIRSFVAVALPKMSKATNSINKEKVKEIFYNYTGILSILIIPILAILFFSGEYLIYILGGEKYINSVNIFYIFLIYGLFLPLDRFLGVTLDSINLPQLNLYKTIFMAIINIIGDFIAIYFFKSLHAVAIVTIINVLIGIYFGVFFLKKEIGIEFFKIFFNGKNLVKENLMNLKKFI